MEGPLSVPPERGTIIGKPVWKVRWVVIGRPTRDQTQSGTGSRGQTHRTSAPRELTRTLTGDMFLTIYKSKDDTEPIQQYAVSSIADCQLQTLAHRKQGPALPTMVISMLPDPQSDKSRKRRSSRTAAFSAPRETGPTTLLFRPAEERHNLQEWVRFIQKAIQPYVPDRVPMSPLTPASPTFANPFTPRPREGSDAQQRPGSRNGSRSGFFTKNPGQAGSARDRPVTFSDAPSLRSKRSDLSSQTGSTTQSHTAFPTHAAIVPADLPSPATTIGDLQGELIEGWTSAQGRSSALGSPIRGRGSVSSQGPAPQPPAPDTNPLPAPRETILDRAFQLRCIPGSEREIPGEERMSSLARFEALMREIDEKRKQREAQAAESRAQAASDASGGTSSSQPKSAFDRDGSGSDSERDSDDDSDNDSDGVVGEGDGEDQFPSASAQQRALDFIAGKCDAPRRRHQARPRGMRSPPTYNHEAFMALSTPAYSQSRPQTGYSRTRGRPGMSQRTHSQPQLATMLASSSALEPPMESEDGPGFSFTPGSPSATHRHSAEKRHSGSSTKRLSLTELTRRLSSASSLLLVQTNTSGPSSRRPSNGDMESQPPHSPIHQLHHLYPRAGQTAPQQYQPLHSPPLAGERERRGWRGSVGVFGDGGFFSTFDIPGQRLFFPLHLRYRAYISSILFVRLITTIVILPALIKLFFFSLFLANPFL
ncbi:hypothetical protein VTH06DRAFT_6506 [Thermothelomyces fergusii]